MELWTSHDDAVFGAWVGWWGLAESLYLMWGGVGTANRLGCEGVVLYNDIYNDDCFCVSTGGEGLVKCKHFSHSVHTNPDV